MKDLFLGQDLYLIVLPSPKGLAIHKNKIYKNLEHVKQIMKHKDERWKVIRLRNEEDITDLVRGDDI